MYQNIINNKGFRKKYENLLNCIKKVKISVFYNDSIYTKLTKH
jgi:hypothetical protein